MTATATLEKIARTVDPHLAPAAPRPLRISLFDSFLDLEALAHEWDDLASRSNSDLFSTYDWCRIWWKHFGSGRCLRVYAIFDEDQLVAVFPLFWEQMRWGPVAIRVIRLVGTDHGVTTAGCVVDRRYLGAAAASLADELDGDARWDIVHFGELPGYSAHYADLALALRRLGWNVEHRADVYPHMVYELSGSFDEFLQTLSASERSNIRRRERRVQEQHTTSVTVAVEEDAPRLFENFVAQHQSQWTSSGRLGHFGDWPESLDFHHEMVTCQASLGRLLLMALRLDEDVIGYHYNYLFNGRAHLLLSSRTDDPKWDTISPGRLLNCSLIRTAIDAGASLIDALGGYYEHKRRLGAKVLNLQTIALKRPGLLRGMRLRSFTGLTRLMDFVYHRAWYWHLAPAIRLRFPRVGAWARKGLSRRFLRARFLVASWRKPPVDIECPS
jgi:CelD/BcsL family acetyltransferase involved in cellulose biosynthesis